VNDAWRPEGSFMSSVLCLWGLNMSKYIRPKALHKWEIDIPSQEYEVVAILDNGTVLSACGRYAQGSGSKSVSWSEFLDGRMHDLVIDAHGPDVLAEVIAKLQDLV
jgi:hypothetical protein